MVTLNLTIVVQVLLFLAFMAVCHVYVFRPILRLTDERDEQIENDQNAAEASQEQARRHEEQYQREIVAARRQGSRLLENALRKAMDNRVARVTERRREAEAAVTAVAETALAEIERERANYDALVPALSGVILERLALGGSRK